MCARKKNMNEWMNEEMNYLRNEWMDKYMEIGINGLDMCKNKKNEWMKKWMTGEMTKRISVRIMMNKWMNRNEKSENKQVHNE